MSGKSSLVRFGIWFVVSVVVMAYVLEFVMNMQFAGNIIFGVFGIGVIIGVLGVIHHKGGIHFGHVKFVGGFIFALISGTILIGTISLPVFGNHPLWSIQDQNVKIYVAITFIISLIVLYFGIRGMVKSGYFLRPFSFMRKNR